MSKVFRAVKPALWAIDAVIAHAILLLWVSTLQAQLRHGREPRHRPVAEPAAALAES